MNKDQLVDMIIDIAIIAAVVITAVALFVTYCILKKGGML